MKISKYVTKYNLGQYVAYYHNLRMKPVYLSLEEDYELQKAIHKNIYPNLSSDTLNSLKKYLILINSNDNEDNIIPFVQKHVPNPYISLAYFVLTEQCNLACKYCFLGNNASSPSKVTNYPMSIKTADEALYFFCKQTQQDPSQFLDEKEIIFYGGEPLINFDTLKYVVQRSKYYQSVGELSKNLKFSIVTNGLLLDTDKINFLIENNINVSISIDGPNALSNNCRVNKLNQPIFEQLISKLKLAKKMNLNFGLSITLTENTIHNLKNLIDFIEQLNIKSVCFNVLFKVKHFNIEKNYYISATNFIIDFYKQTKHKGIYEDRIMRKISAFAESKIYFSDCAATSGSQIVITPDGDVGICHGCIENREYFVGNISDKNLIVAKNKDVIQWSKLHPIFQEKCHLCPALGICGGGCPINAKNLSKTNSINSIDTTFCIQAKKILHFLISELLNLMLKA